MAKTYKPGFIYIKSEVLKQEVAWRKRDGRVFCEDGVQYSPQEMALFEKAGCEIDIATHNVKKVLGGEVVKIEYRQGTGIEGKQAENGQGNNTTNSPDTSQEVSGANGISAENPNGELDIF